MSERMDASAHVLVVDDEPIVRDVLSRYLIRSGFSVDGAADGEAALAAFEKGAPDLVLLDLMLPRLDGIEVFRRIRTRASTPVIMLTAKGAEADRIAGLELGADDYVTKPFSPREIVARVRAVLRRTASEEDAGDHDEPLDVAGMHIDPRGREVTRAGRPVSLTPKEFDMLQLMASHPRTVFSRGQLLEEVWDIAFDGDPSTVTVHVRRLREKIESDPSRPRHLVTVWGAGYRFDP
jgi:two-component system, OmpR family, response regulator ResD